MSVKKGIFFLLMTGSVSVGLAQSAEPSRLEFIPNHRQWDDRVLYQAEMKGGKIFVERNALTFVYLDPKDLATFHPSRGADTTMRLHAHALRVSFENANKQVLFTAGKETGTTYNFFSGKDPRHWATDLHAAREVTAENVFPGIDLKYYSNGSDFKYDWIVQAGSDPSVIRMKYDGCVPVIAGDGSLQLDLSVGRAKELKPIAYQVIDGERRIVECRYKLKNNTLSLEFPGGFDNSEDLIIDPTLVFSSYTGSTADNWGFTATFDHSGNAITGGNVNNFGYPVTTGAYQMNYGGGGTGGNGWSCDMAIAKFNASGTSLLFATYLGGSDNEEPHSIVVDGNNDIIILGLTFSSNYPVTAGAYDNTINGGGDMVVSKLSSSGNALLGSTFIGGSGDDGVNVSAVFTTQYSLKFNYGDDARGEIISDAGNNYIVSCVTQSANFPVTGGVIQPAYGGGLQDGVIFKLSSNLSSLLWSTYFGGTDVDACYDILQETSGNFYVTGGTGSSNLPVTAGVYQGSLSASSIDGYILHMDSNAAAVLQCTYVGTPGPDQTYFVEQDRPGDIYVLGQTGGAYPVSPGVYANPNSGQFIQKFNPQLSASLFSTTFGTGVPVPDICPTAFLVDTCQNIYAAGWGRCINYGGVFSAGQTFGLPVTGNAIQSTTDGCDFYFIILTPDAGSLLYATFFGGSLSQEHVDGGTSRFDKNGIIYESVCAGCGGNSDFPTQPGVVSQSNNSSNCNNAVIKLDFDLASVVATAQATPDSGCTSKPIAFNAALSSGVLNYYWDFGDGSPADSSLNPAHAYSVAGNYTAHFYFSGVCNSGVIPVSIYVQDPVLSGFTYSIDTCTSVFSFINGSPAGNSYLWNFGDGNTDTSYSPFHVFDSSGVYTVFLTVNPGACPSVTSVQIPYTDLDTAFAAVQVIPDTGCIGSPVNFIALNNTGVLSYYWDFGDGSPLDTTRSPSHTYASTGSYTACFFVTGYCNTDSFPLTVRIDPAAAAAFSYTVDTCSSRIAFTNSSTNGITYLWNFGDGRTDTGFSPVHLYATSGNYTVTLTVNPGPCQAVDTRQIQFTDLDTAFATALIIPDTGCVNSPVQFSAIYNSAVLNHYWNFGDGSPVDTSLSPGHTYSAAGNYQASLVIAGYCNTDTVPLAVTVLEKGISSFIYSIDSCTSLVSFSNTSTSATSYLWDFGDGQTDTSLSPVHLYDTTGSYPVSLTVNAGPCESSSTVALVVNASDTAQFFVPNVFTPNGDGKNDVFVIRGINSCSEYFLKVYNRWGRKVFESSAGELFWDGTIDGHDAAEGVYYYLLELDGKNFNGHVTLLRK